MFFSEGELQELKLSTDKVDTLSILMTEQVCEIALKLSNSGWSDEEYLEIRKLHQEDGVLYAVASISFQEVIPSSCADMPHLQERFELVKFEIDLVTGEVKFPYDDEQLEYD